MKYQRGSFVAPVPPFQFDQSGHQNWLNQFRTMTPNMGAVQQPPQYQTTVKNEWGQPNYGHIATSNTAQAILAYLRGRRNEKDFQAYDAQQQNPLLQIPFTPNTSDQSQFGTQLFKAGGPTASKAREMLRDGTANGKKLTAKQKRYFGWIAGGKKNKKYQLGGEIDDEIENEIFADPANTMPEGWEDPRESEEDDVTRGRGNSDLTPEEIDLLSTTFTARRSYDEDLDMESPSVNPLEAFKRGIAGSEKAGYFSATNIKGEDGKPASSAFGKYQFIKGTREDVRQRFFPDMSATAFEKQYKTSPEFQEKVMDAYGGYLLGKYGNPKKAATAFYLGEGKADMFNQPNYRPTAGNSTVGQYLNRFKQNYQTGGPVQEVKTKGSANFKTRQKFTPNGIPIVEYIPGPMPETKDVDDAYLGAMKFFKDYVKSPKYKERLKKAGYEDPDAVVKARSKRAETFKLVEGVGHNLGNTYNPFREEITVDRQEMSQIGAGPHSVAAHEFSHRVGAVPDNFKGKYTDLNNWENTLINRHNRSARTWPEHDARSWEAKADLDAFRYMLKKDGLYDTGTQDFTPEHLQKAKEKYKDLRNPENFNIRRLFGNFDDKALIEIMNSIAGNPNNLPQVKQGGTYELDDAQIAELKRQGYEITEL